MCKLYNMYMFIFQVVQSELKPAIHVSLNFLKKFILKQKRVFYYFTFRLSGSSERPA